MSGFTCTAVVRDGDDQITVGYDAKRSDWMFGMSVVLNNKDRDRCVTVNDISLVGDYVRVYYMAGHDFNAPRVALFLRMGGSTAFIGSWRTVLDESGEQPQSMHDMERLSREGIYATQPHEYADSPYELADVREVELVSFTLNTGE